MPILESAEVYTIAAAGATKSFNLDNTSNPNYRITTTAGGAVTLAANMIFQGTGTPVANMMFTFLYEGQVTIGANTLSFFGTALTAEQALNKQIIICFYTGSAWQVYIFSVDNNATVDINGADIIALSIPTAALADQSVTLAKIANAAVRGSIIRSGVSGALQELRAETAGTFVGGNGVDVVTQTMSGDATLNGSGVLTLSANAVDTAEITNAAVTVAKVSADLKADMKVIEVSFETGEQAAYAIRMSYPGSITNVYARAVKAIAATDSGTITIRDNAATTMTVTTPIVFAASDPINTTYSSAVTANNTFVDGDIITITPVKTTAGGKVLVTLEILRS